jgi:hypothetical protein
MRISKRVPITIFVAGVAALSAGLMTGVLSALGSEHGKGNGGQLVKESLAPSVPTDPAFHGVIPGNAPWVLKDGKVRLSSHTLDLRVRGLVIPAPTGNGTPGPVTTISASLFCGMDSDTTAADTTGQVPISRDGDARIRDDSFEVPSTCLAPVILVHPNGLNNLYITVDGWKI